MMNASDLVVYVDVDDTLVRQTGQKRIPMVAVIEHVRLLHQNGATLYCWSAGGGDYAQSTARELGIESLFRGFLPKPHVLVDDQPPVSGPTASLPCPRASPAQRPQVTSKRLLAENGLADTRSNHPRAVQRQGTHAHSPRQP